MYGTGDQERSLGSVGTLRAADCRGCAWAAAGLWRSAPSAGQSAAPCCPALPQAWAWGCSSKGRSTRWGLPRTRWPSSGWTCEGAAPAVWAVAAGQQWLPKRREQLVPSSWRCVCRHKPNSTYVADENGAKLGGMKRAISGQSILIGGGNVPSRTFFAAEGVTRLHPGTSHRRPRHCP